MNQGYVLSSLSSFHLNAKFISETCNFSISGTLDWIADKIVQKFESFRVLNSHFKGTNSTPYESSYGDFPEHDSVAQRPPYYYHFNWQKSFPFKSSITKTSLSFTEQRPAPPDRETNCIRVTAISYILHPSSHFQEGRSNPGIKGTFDWDKKQGDPLATSRRFSNIRAHLQFRMSPEKHWIIWRTGLT